MSSLPDFPDKPADGNGVSRTPLPDFPDKPADGNGVSRTPQPYGGTRYQNGVVSSIGGSGNNAITYTFTNSTTNPIKLVMFEELRDKINSERVRRGGTTTSISITNPIKKDTFNAIKNNLGYDASSTVLGQAYNSGFINRDSSDARYISGYSYWYTDKGGTVYYQPVYSYPMPDPTASTFYGPSAPSVGITDRSITDKIYATDINSVISALQTAGAVCTCNCNYCTCNCNYCTCNCNYSCTCNCNYSDKRLKENIVAEGNVEGLNVYSWNYIWSPQRYKGIIAQELIGTPFEDALFTDSNGYYTVDYSKLPVDMVEVS